VRSQDPHGPYGGPMLQLLSGHYPQPHMKNQPGRELCLFDRRTRTAVVSDADGILRGKSPVPSANP